MSGRARDPVLGHILLEVETYEDGGKTKSRQKCTCVHCGKMQVFANVGRLRAQLSGDDSIAAKDGGGWGACTAAPVLVKQKFKEACLELLLTKKRLADRHASRSANDAAALAAGGTGAPGDSGAPPSRRTTASSSRSSSRRRRMARTRKATTSRRRASATPTRRRRASATPTRRRRARASTRSTMRSWASSSPRTTRASSSDSREACTSGGGRAVGATPPRYREMPRI
ncbi:hypothetical protein M885DRAFT_293178 [Pelagophyceae sp. CCMP2097]|nr:hypothetical protein M885DRAFT_293178 [Pelagophyceae sp. CCMP2097]